MVLEVPAAFLVCAADPGLTQCMPNVCPVLQHTHQSAFMHTWALGCKQIQPLTTQAIYLCVRMCLRSHTLTDCHKCAG